LTRDISALDGVLGGLDGVACSGNDQLVVRVL
jgi:hypothetical protein